MPYYISIKTGKGTKRIPVPMDVYSYIRQLETYINNPKESKLLEAYPNRFNIKKGGEMERTLDQYMMATTAIHKLGDISNDVPDLCHVYAEDEDNYYGMWVIGYGFFDVKFPKKTTCKLTTEEVVKFNKMSVQISDHPPIKLKVD